jgi:hypothetical protein
MPIRLARTARWVAPVLAAAVVAAGCSSSGSKASSGTTANLASCPFSGTTAATADSTGPANSSVTSVTTSKAGCIDNIAFKFSTAPPGWSAGYKSGPFVDSGTGANVTVPGPNTLVVTFAGTTYGEGKTPTTVAPKGLDYVTAINVVSGPNGSLQWIFSLPQQAQYMTSQSNVPSNFTVAIG